MFSVKNLDYDTVPLRYDLSFSNLTIHVHILSDVFSAIRGLLTNPAYNLGLDQGYQNYPQVAAWQTIPDEPGPFGYGGVATYATAKDGVVVCSVPLPRTKNPINQAASLEALFDLVWSLEVREREYQFTSPSQQLITVDKMLINVTNRSHWAGISVLFSRELVDWISSKHCTRKTQSVIIQGMQDAHTHMAQAFCDKTTARELAEDGCKFFLIEERRPCFTAPGDACDLAPDGMSRADPEYGCNLGPHNVDSHIQQLTLLVGVAKLGELARASITKQGAP